MSRVLLVGAGLMGRWHAHACRAAGAQILGVVDPDERAALSIGGPGVATFASLKAALESKKPTVVHVCSPVEQHADDARRALEAGAHVIVEKPVADELATTLELVALAESRGVSITPVHQLPFQPWTAHLGDVGPILRIEHAICSAGGDGQTETARTQLALGIAWHGLSLAERILPPGGLRDLHWHVVSQGPGELTALTSSQTTVVCLSVSLAGRPTRNELTVVGGAGTLRADLFHGFGRVARSGVTRTDKVLAPFRRAGGELASAATNLGRRAKEREPAFPGLQSLIAAVHDHADGGAELALPHSHLVDVATAAQALCVGTMG